MIELRSYKNVRSLRTLFKDATIDDLNEIIEKMIALKNEIEEEQRQEMEADAERRQAFEELKKTLTDKNYSYEDFKQFMEGGVSKPARKTGTRKMTPKYRYTDLEGITREWTGQGKTPNALKQLMEQTGNDKSFYLIDKEEKPAEE